MHGDGERPLYFLVQLVDLSERRRAEAERRAGEQRLQAIIDNAPALIFVKDVEQRFLLVNRRWEELFGVSADAAVGRTAAEVLPSSQARRRRRPRPRGRPHAASRARVEVRSARRDGEDREFLLVKFPLLDADGPITGGLLDRDGHDRAASAPSATAWSSSSGSRRRSAWRASASSPAASPTTSTTCCR